MAASNTSISALLLAGFALRLALAPFGSFQGDADAMRAWAMRLTTVPLSDFYAARHLVLDHLPADLWILFAVTRAFEFFSPHTQLGGMPFLLLLKLVPALADLAIGWLLYLIAARLGSARAGFFGAALFLFNPASLFLTSIWGQWDAVSAFFSLAAVWLMVRGNYEWSFPVLVCAALIKPPLAALGPLLILAVIRRHAVPRTPAIAHHTGRLLAEPLGRLLRRCTVALGASALVLLTLTLPFNVGVPPFSTRWNLLSRMEYAWNYRPWTTAGAFNLWASPVGGHLQRDGNLFLLGLNYRIWAQVLLGCAVLTVLILY